MIHIKKISSLFHRTESRDVPPLADYIQVWRSIYLQVIIHYCRSQTAHRTDNLCVKGRFLIWCCNQGDGQPVTRFWRFKFCHVTVWSKRMFMNWLPYFNGRQSNFADVRPGRSPSYHRNEVKKKTEQRVSTITGSQMITTNRISLREV